MSMEEDRSLDKLKRFIDSSITDFFGAVLDYTEVAVDGKERHANLRSRILKLGNDSIRDIKRELEQHYVVKYQPTTEDVIKVKQ